MAIAFSDDWARAWGTTLAASPEYRQVAVTWEGSVAAVAGDEPNAPAVFLDLWHGDCRTARAATEADLASATYLLQAAPSAWRDLFEGRLAPVMALLTGRIQIMRGELATLLPYTAAAKELLRLAGTVPTEFPTGW
ncbi:MAG: SCP2 sterol-binding domain-containing protein [Gemmatimonadales bacterium]